MRLNAQELSVQKRRAFQRHDLLSVRKRHVVEHARSNFTLSSTNSASGGRPNATRDGAYSGTAGSACGSSAAAGSDTVLSMLIVKTEPWYPRSKPLPRSWPSAASIASGKTLSTGVAYGQSKGPTHWCE